MKRLTTRELINHFGDFPNVRVSTSEGFRHVDSIRLLRSGDVLVCIADGLVVALSGESFEIPAIDLDNPMWDIF